MNITINIAIEIDGNTHNIPYDDAKKMYLELKNIFDGKPTHEELMFMDSMNVTRNPKLNFDHTKVDSLIEESQSKLDELMSKSKKIDDLLNKEK
jgi:hypothetical protein